jgi:ankyrin repeat protein
MGIGDKISNAAEELKGKVKETAGNATDNEELEADGAYLLAGALGRLEILRMVLSYGADLQSTNRYGGTALIPACERGHVETVQALLAAGVKADQVKPLGWTCQLENVLLGEGGPRYQEIVRQLIAAKADLSLPDKDGVTALAHARQRSQHEVERLLREAGAR